MLNKEEKWDKQKAQNKMVYNNKNTSQVTKNVNWPNLQLKEQVSHAK